MSSLFVTLPGALESPIPGGVQLCSQEYRNVLMAAGFDCRVWPVTMRYSLDARVRRRLLPHMHFTSDFERESASLVEEIQRAGIRTVFLNLVDLAPMARALRQRLGDRCSIILLSHGLSSADYLHQVRMARSAGRPALSIVGDAARLGMQLLEEVEHRRHIDHVLCLSETERQLELWLGARQATWVPRIGRSSPVDWRPVTGRIGFVGTLDHPPSVEGLDLYLQALSELGGAEVRIVGGPPARGAALAHAFPFVKYLGSLDDRALVAEASTWSCMVHPLFCYARGCSTKLAMGLAWEIPIATTPSGRRGYRWREGSLPMADSPKELAQLTLSMGDGERREQLRRAVQTIVATMPTSAEVVELVRAAIGAGR